MNPYAPPAQAPPELPKGVESGIEDPSAPARWTIGLSIAGAVLMAVSAGFTLAGFATAVTLTDGVGYVVWLGSLVLFLVWTYRVVKNARLIDPREMKIGPGWAVGSYFVPFVNFVVPCVALCQASRASGRGTGLVILWWLLTIGQILGIAVLGVLFFRSITFEMMESGDLPEPRGLLWGGLVSEFLIVWVEATMVLAITRAQRDWRER